MLKKERLMTLTKLCDQEGVITVSEMVELLQVSEMTIRRDLDELARSGKLIRIHGGAQSIKSNSSIELSYLEKKELHLNEKMSVAKEAARQIKNGETVYLGPGTTVELISKYVTDRLDLRIVTNSLPVFSSWKDSGVELILVGGIYRERSQTFIGSLTDKQLGDLKFNKAFVGVNGLHNESMMTTNPEEGKTQARALDNAYEKFVVADEYKLNRDDFYKFYSLYSIDGLITNEQITENISKHYRGYTRVILAK